MKGKKRSGKGTKDIERKTGRKRERKMKGRECTKSIMPGNELPPEPGHGPAEQDSPPAGLCLDDSSLTKPLGVGVHIVQESRAKPRS